MLKFDIVKVLKDRNFKRRWPWGHFSHEYTKKGLGSLPKEWESGFLSKRMNLN